MTIEIQQPELEALIHERMASGAFQSVEDVLLQALEHMPVPERVAEPPRKKQNLDEFLMNSPLRGSGLVIERSKDGPRPVEF